MNAIILGAEEQATIDQAASFIGGEFYKATSGALTDRLESTVHRLRVCFKDSDRDPISSYCDCLAKLKRLCVEGPGNAIYDTYSRPATVGEHVASILALAMHGRPNIHRDGGLFYCDWRHS